MNQPISRSKFDFIGWHDNVNVILGSDNYYNYMNHGYYPPYKKLFGYHKIFKHQASLYLHLFDGIDTNNKSLLEVGCGRGGGINLLSEMLVFKNIEACDLTESNITHCQKYATNDIKFKVADAENLDYDDDQFDIVINVESSHCYKDLNPFFFKVQKILKSDGVFLYTDVFEPQHIDYVEQNLSHFFKTIKEDITDNVMQSCEYDIEYFDTVLPDKDSKEFYINIAKDKGKRYREGELLYIKYVGKTI